MKYKVLIKRCEDPQRASAVAAEVARWSGSPPDLVYNAVMTKGAICIRKEADEDEAMRLRAQFGAIGAEVELVPLDGRPAVAMAPAAPAAAAAAVPAAASYSGSAPGGAPAVQRHDDDDEDDDDEPGRVLTDAEYTAMVKQRSDIFYVERTSRLRNIEIVCLLLAVGAGIFLSTRTVVAAVAVDFFEKFEERTAKILKEEVSAVIEEKKKDEEKKEDTPSDKKQLKPTKSQGVSSNQGGGDPRARVTAQGVLGIVSGQIKGKSVASADIFGKGGFATDIDAILSGVGGLKSGGDGGVGRKGMAGIGYGQGYGSGFGGGAGGVSDLLGGLMGPGSGNLDLKKKGDLKMTNPDFVKGLAMTGGRSRASIQRVVMQNLSALRYAYNRRVRDKPGLAGTVTVKFAIDEFGKVIFAQVVGSTINDSELENTVVTRVRAWVFEKIDKPGDVTEVTYPFAFSQ